MLRRPPEDPYLPGRPDPHISVSRYELDLEYRVATNRLDAHATVHGTATERIDRIDLRLAGLKVTRVTVNGRKPAKWVHRGDVLSVRLHDDFETGTVFAVDVDYQGTPGPLMGPWGDVGWEELTEGALVAGQPDGAPSWFPCHDHPSDKATFRIAVSTESPYRAVCNGSLVERKVKAGRTRWVYEHEAPMATYLATVQIGRYEEWSLSSKPVAQRVVAPPALRSRAKADFAEQPRMLALFEDLFGPYPFDSYTVVVAEDSLEIPLEAQGLSIFGENHVDGMHVEERLIAHELAHQWFGNSLTLRRWQDIWLHEGFACYAEWLWSEESGADSADTKARAAHARLSALPQELVVQDPGPDAMFDDRLYKRGAITLHALRLEIGDSAFFDLLREWTLRHRHGSVDTAGFITRAESGAARSLGDFFTAWIGKPELPDLPVA
ncbi:M1 family metallopeptidase [Demequina flava]|uniref:M1 family metallopeptidase n=1 Tax=Demequina flava TaxID=1095025 RepID=UPI000782716C|nr:M1 family metallopeptidase [Demequina flava]